MPGKSVTKTRYVFEISHCSVVKYMAMMLTKRQAIGIGMFVKMLNGKNRMNNDLNIVVRPELPRGETKAEVLIC